MIAHGLPVYVALAPVDMRLGYERLGGLVREKMQAEPRSRALFVFVGKRGQTMKVLTWDGTGVIVISKKLDAGKFELPRATSDGDQHAYSGVIRSAFRRHSISVPKVSDQDSGAIRSAFRSFDQPFRAFDQSRPSG